MVQLSGAELGNSESGRASVNLDGASGQACVLVQVDSGTKPASLHIHEGPPGAGRPVVVEIPLGAAGTGCVTKVSGVSSVQGDRNRFYVDVHVRGNEVEVLRGTFSPKP